MTKFIPMIWVRKGKVRTIDLEDRNLFTFRIHNSGELVFKAKGGNRVEVFGSVINDGVIRLPSGSEMHVRGKIVLK